MKVELMGMAAALATAFLFSFGAWLAARRYVEG